MDEISYPLSSPAVFRTVQGEGVMLGVPMTFLRLAGCSIGCASCDTDYRVKERADIPAIMARIAAVTPKSGWVWVTGGEPTDHDLGPLLKAIRLAGFLSAVATAGHKAVDANWRMDWLSVSPHDPARWVQDWGNELKLVPGLNGFGLADFAEHRTRGFQHRYVSPCDGKPETVAECVAWLDSHDQWKMTTQAHKRWSLL